LHPITLFFKFLWYYSTIYSLFLSNDESKLDIQSPYAFNTLLYKSVSLLLYIFKPDSKLLLNTLLFAIIKNYLFFPSVVKHGYTLKLLFIPSA